MLKMCYRLLRNNDKGFTLIELMVVVVILGVLAAVAVPQLGGKTDDAKDNRARADLKVLESALELYYFDNNAYPATGITALTAALETDYIKKVKQDPWGEDYIYDKTQFEADDGTGLYSKGKDMLVTGTDNIEYLD